MRPGSRRIEKAVWIALAVSFRSLSSILTKKAALLDAGFPSTLLSPWYAAALFALFLQSLWWIMVLRVMALNVAYPFLSLVVVVNTLSAAVFFHETIYGHQVAGVILIVVVVVLIGTHRIMAVRIVGG